MVSPIVNFSRKRHHGFRSREKLTDPEPGTRRGWAWAVAVLAVLAYVPALLSSRGRMPADTKLYLYLDPGRLISDAPWTFDARQFAGWVPHQVIAYLWPQGPWYWLGEQVGLPDWVVQRLWLGSLFFAAGTGVLWLARRLGLGLAAALAAAFVYQLTPYVLPYASRTSAMLLPWAGLGWIVGLTVLAATRTRWRHAALCALVILSVGAVNATALLMIAPAPVLWLVLAAVGGTITWRRAVTTALRIGVLALGTSAWWIAAVAVQGRLGADVLAYSESLESVSYTSTSPEVWRGLGYWLTYIRDIYAPTTSAGRDYMVSGRLIATGFVLLLVGLAGLVTTRWRHARFAIALVVTGVILGVGVHPIDDPSPLMDLLLGDATSGAALALRSSTRAVPLVVLGLALGAGALVDACRGVRLGDRRPVVAVIVAVLAVANLPALTGRRWVDPAIDRDQDPPGAWQAASAALDDGDTRARVLQLPGQEFGAFRWGYTVDPPLPGMTDKPLVTRDLLPLGSAAAMDLLYALDDRFQTGTVEPEAVVPIARLLGADTIWVTGDAAFERFRTARPEVAADLFASGVPGTGEPRAFGDPAVNVPDIPIVDEESLADPRVGEPIPPVLLVPVTDAVPVVRAKDDVVLVTGSGDGLVDAAAAGLIDGHELVRYTGSLDGEELATAAATASALVVTDSNRDRAHHWRGSQDVTGMTEDDDPATPDVLRADPADERLPVFGDDEAAPTVAVQEGPVRARASGYGEPFAYRPEDRAVMAIDGDPATAWRVADRASAIGEHLELTIDEPIDHLTLRQPLGAEAVRHIGRVSIRVDDREPVTVDLDERSFRDGGQRVDLPPTTGPSTVRITIEDVVVPDPTLGPALAAVGFAEVGTGLAPTVEVVRPPADAVAALAAVGEETPVSFVLTRLRTRPTNRWRSDPEPALVREIELPGARSFDPGITVRLHQRASDDVLAELLGITGPRADRRLTGAAAAAGWAAADGDPTTAWTTPFARAVGATLELRSDTELTSFTLTQPGGEHSPITSLRLQHGDITVDVAVPPPDVDGTSTVTLPTPLPAGDLTLTITAVEPRITLDRRYGEPVEHPAAISELSIGPRATVPERIDTGCRDDLLSVDGTPLPVRVTGTLADALAGAPLGASVCGDEQLVLDAGTHRIASTPGARTGLDVDRVVLTSGVRRDAPAAPTATVTGQGRLHRDVTVDGCRDGCWLVLGEGFHESWSASTAAGDLGAPQLVDGGFNGWWIPPSDGPVEVAIRWTAQRPLTIALALTVLTVLACIVLALLDRRREPAPVTVPPRFAVGEPALARRRRLVAAAAWVVAAGLLVAPGWALVAAVSAAVLVVVLGRPRAAGAVTMGALAVIGAVMVHVVRTERPWPDAGWPSRFEWLHRLGVFAAVTLGVVLFAAQCRPGERQRPAGEDGEERAERQVEARVPPEQQGDDDERGHGSEDDHGLGA
jgi:arabinofuranan 3-O-arabinosyltransferase